MIELIAVMVILTILASSTIGSYSGFNQSLRLFEEVRDMSRKIQYARDYCIARNESFFLKVDAAATPSTYSLFHNNIFFYYRFRSAGTFTEGNVCGVRKVFPIINNSAAKVCGKSFGCDLVTDRGRMAAPGT